MKGGRRVETNGGESLGQSPFAALTGAGLPEGQPAGTDVGRKRNQNAAPKKRGRVEIRREKSGRGGKTVTTATAFQGVCPAELEAWTAELRKRCGAGGTTRSGGLEIQGDRRDELVCFFEEKGFRPVRAGG